MLSARTRVTEPEQKMSHHHTGPTHEHWERHWVALGWGAAVRSRDPCGSPRHALTGAGRPASLARGGPAGQRVLNLPPFPLPHFLRPPSPKATPAGPPRPPAAAAPDSGRPSSAQGQTGLAGATASTPCAGSGDPVLTASSLGQWSTPCTPARPSPALCRGQPRSSIRLIRRTARSRWQKPGQI